MKKLYILVLSVISVAPVSLLNAFSKRIHYKNLSAHLPENSKIRQVCEQVSGNWLSGKSETEAHCDCLENHFIYIAQRAKEHGGSL